MEFASHYRCCHTCPSSGCACCGRCPDVVAGVVRANTPESVGAATAMSAADADAGDFSQDWQSLHVRAHSYLTSNCMGNPGESAGKDKALHCKSQLGDSIDQARVPRAESMPRGRQGADRIS